MMYNFWKRIYLVPLAYGLFENLFEKVVEAKHHTFSMEWLLLIGLEKMATLYLR